MAEERVVFLEVPVQGQRASIFLNGQTASTSPAKTVEFKEGWYRVTTASSSVYTGQLKTQQQPALADNRTVYQQPQQACQPQAQQTITAPPAPYPPTQYPQRKKTTVFGVTVLIALVLIVAFIGRALLRVVASAVSTNTNTASARNGQTADKPEVELLDWHFESEEFGSKIVGSVRNNTDEEYGYIQVEFNLYDSDGNQVDSTFTNCNNLEPHKTWQFECPILSDKATSAKFKGISTM